MFRLLTVFAVILLLPLLATGDLQPADSAAGLPVGKWQVKFANGVVETCEVAPDGVAKETEPLRSSPGKATLKERSAVIAFDDDRVERWTQVGN